MQLSVEDGICRGCACACNAPTRLLRPLDAVDARLGYFKQALGSLGGDPERALVMRLGANGEQEAIERDTVVGKQAMQKPANGGHVINELLGARRNTVPNRVELASHHPVKGARKRVLDR
jgi:hypothetical protein